MPDDYYVSQYSGEEWDSLLAGAAGGVRYDKAQSLTTDQKAQARSNIEAAPSGYGWGEESPRLVSTAAEVDAITTNSVVRYANDLTNLVDGDSNSSTRYAIVVTHTVNATDKAQDVYGFGGGAHGDVMLHRGRSGNTWLPWEWVNPPMALGVEYRTTERCQGKPVYTKRISCGDFVADKSILWYDNLSEIAFIKDINVSSYRMTFPDSYASGGTIVLRGSDSWGGTVFACIKYTKTTD